MIAGLKLRGFPDPGRDTFLTEIHEGTDGWMRARGYVRGRPADIMFTRASIDGLSVDEVREFARRNLPVGVLTGN